MALTAESIIEYIVRHCGGREEDLERDALLFSTGVLDSFSLVDLITFVEAEVGIKVKPTEVTLDNFDAVDRILAFVARKTDG